MALDNLNDIRLFVQVAESGNLSRAARVVGAPPNTVSRTIARLEESLGVRLLVRTTRTMSLTDEGRAFYEHAIALLECASRAEEAVGAEGTGLRGTVRVAVRTTTVQFSLVPALQSLLEAHPKLRVQLLVADADVDPVANGLDVALRVGERADSSLRSRTIGTVIFVLAASSEYLRRRGRPDSPEELAQHSLVLPMGGRTHSSMTLFGPKGKRATVLVSGQFECNDVRTQREAVYCGMGIAARPLGEVEEATASGKLERVLAPWHLEPLPVFVLYPPLKPGPRKARAVEAVVDLLSRAVSKMNGGARPRS